MPTPIPIMVARVGATVAKVDSAAISPSTPRPTTAANRAVTSGSPAAIALRKPISSTTIATAKPITSLRRSSGSGCASSPSGPPYSTWTPASRNGATAASTPSR